MRVVGDGIGQIAKLRFQTGLGAIQEPCGHTARFLRFYQERIASGAVFQNAFTRFEGEVQAIKVWITFFQLIHHTQALQVVFKPTKGLHAFIQGVLACMAKWRVAQVVRQGHRLDQIFVQPQCTGNRTT